MIPYFSVQIKIIFIIIYMLKLKYNQVIQRLISSTGSVWHCLAQTSFPHALSKPNPSNPFQACLHSYRAPIKISLYVHYNPRTIQKTLWHWILWKSMRNYCNHFSSGWNETHTAHTSHEASPVYTDLLTIPSKTQKKGLTTLKRGLFVSHLIQICHEASLFILTTHHKSSHILAAALQLASTVISC